jgi:hypothetical protein
VRVTARPASTLAVVCLVTFMLLLDISVVVVALPSMVPTSAAASPTRNGSATPTRWPWSA